jgi:hypothetical protein
MARRRVNERTEVHVVYLYREWMYHKRESRHNPFEHDTGLKKCLSSVMAQEIHSDVRDACISDRINVLG